MNMNERKSAKLLKTILGPACFFIDTFIYSYKFTYGLMEYLFDL